MRLNTETARYCTDRQLGDAFLKYLSSIYVFVANPAQKEGALHVLRQRIISNRSLLRNAISSGLPQYIQARPFTFKSWQPPNFSVESGFDPKDDSSTPPPEGSEGPEIKAMMNVSPLPKGSELSTGKLESKHKKKSKKKKQGEEIQYLGDKVLLKP